MTDERKISLCIPNFNRYDLLIDSFISSLSDERVDEIIISDDASNPEIYEKVKKFVTGLTKIKLFRNEENQDCYKNKMTSLTYAKNKWCILFDSDNKFGKDYIDALYQIQDWDKYMAILPSFASPHFDYRKYEGREIVRGNVSACANDDTFTTCLNTSNFFINKEFYLKCWDSEVNPHTADSIYMNYLFLNNGGKLYIVPGLTYQHRVDSHDGEESGHYNKNIHKTPVGFHDSIINKLKELR